MHDMIMISHPETEDLPVLKQIWTDVFADPPELIDTFFDRFSPEQYGWIVRCEKQILSTAYLLSGNRFSDGSNTIDAPYVYAVATPAEHRGKGCAGMLMRHFAKLAEAQSALLYTRPASVSLFHWYAACMQTVPAAPLEQRIVAARELNGAALPVTRLSARQYGSRREALLKGTPHIIMSDAFLLLQESFLNAEGGGLFVIGGGICACEIQNGLLVIKEILGPRAEAEQMIQALLNRFSCARASVMERSQAGEPRVAYRAANVQEATNWGLLLD